MTDIHHTEEKYYNLIKKIKKQKTNPTKTILLKYIAWHNERIKNEMSYSSAKRSIEIANEISQQIKDIEQLNQKDIEKWWNKQLTRNKKHRTKDGTIQITKEKMRIGSQQKILSQAIKYFKFIEFLKYNKPINFFSSKKFPRPKCTQFLSISEQGRKKKEKPIITQEQIKQIIDYLNDGTFLGQQCATITSLLNDSGLRFGEALTLKNKSVKIKDNYLLITLEESKTKTRTIVSSLAKEHVLGWLARSPNKNDPEALLFCDSKGKEVSYSRLRLRFRQALKELNIVWPENSSFHYLRHLWVSRSFNWPESLRSYWLGWTLPGMLETYGSFGYKECIPHYAKMIHDENNPMIDQTLSFLHSQQKEEEISNLEKMILKTLKVQGLIKEKEV